MAVRSTFCINACHFNLKPVAAVTLRIRQEGGRVKGGGDYRCRIQVIFSSNMIFFSGVFFTTHLFWKKLHRVSGKPTLMYSVLATVIWLGWRCVSSMDGSLLVINVVMSPGWEAT
jgi:hypothetical protein